jgi:hypothetical protein
MKTRLKISTLIIVLLLGLRNTTFSHAQSIVLLSDSGYVDLSGNYHVVGELENLGTTALQFIIVTVNFYDIDDNFLSSRFDLTMLEVLQPNRITPFDIMLLDVSLSSNVDYYTISTSHSNGILQPEGLQVLNHLSYQDELGIQYITGISPILIPSRAI